MMKRNAGIKPSKGSPSYPTIFSDEFVEASSKILPLHTPNIGKYWSVPITFGTVKNISAIGNGGYAGCPQDVSLAGVRANYGYITNANCEVEIKITQVPSENNATVVLHARTNVDTGLGYWVNIWGNYASSNRKIALYKGFSSSTKIEEQSITWVTPAVIKLRCVGSLITVYYNDEKLIDADDSTYTSGGVCGLGLGRYDGALAYSMYSGWHIDWFRIGESGGVVDSSKTYTPVFGDLTTDVSGTDITAHVPDLGTGWTVASNPGSLAIGIYIQTSVYMTDTKWISCATANSQKAIILANPAPSTADVSVTCVGTIGGIYSSNAYFIIARYQDINNFYCAAIYYASNTADCQIWKVVSGTPTKLASVDANNASYLTSPYKFEIVGNTLKLFKNFVEILSVDDTALPNAGYTGLGWGSVVVGTDRIYGSGGITNFIVREIRAA